MRSPVIRPIDVFITIVVVMILAYIVWSGAESLRSQAQVPSAPVTPYKLSIKGPWLLVDQKPKRETAVKLSAIQVMTIVSRGELGHPAVMLTYSGGTFRLDCESKEKAKEFANYVIEKTREFD